jgi:hypothetical protein
MLARRFAARLTPAFSPLRAQLRSRSSAAAPPAPGSSPSPLLLAGGVLLCAGPLGWLALRHGPFEPAAGAAAVSAQEAVRHAFLGWSAALLAALGAAHAAALAGAAGAPPPLAPPLRRLRVGAAALALAVGAASIATPPPIGAAEHGALRRHHALMAAHLALHAAEEALARVRPPALPGWHMRARAPLTAGVVVAHAVAAYLGGDASVADSREWEKRSGR